MTEKTKPKKLSKKKKTSKSKKIEKDDLSDFAPMSKEEQLQIEVNQLKEKNKTLVDELKEGDLIREKEEAKTNKMILKPTSQKDILIYAPKETKHPVQEVVEYFGYLGIQIKQNMIMVYNNNPYVCKDGCDALAVVIKIKTTFPIAPTTKIDKSIILEVKYWSNKKKEWIIDKFPHKSVSIKCVAIHPNGTENEQWGIAENSEKGKTRQEMSQLLGLAETRAKNRAIKGLIPNVPNATFEEMPKKIRDNSIDVSDYEYKPILFVCPKCQKKEWDKKGTGKCSFCGFVKELKK